MRVSLLVWVKTSLTWCDVLNFTLYNYFSMKDVKVGDSGMKILISRTADGEVYATGSKCTYVP